MTSHTTPKPALPQRIKTLLIGTPSTSAPPSFGRAIAELVFILRAHRIECIEPKSGLTMLEAFRSAAEKPDAILWIEGDVQWRQEDALALVTAVQGGIDIAGLLVPSASGSIDWARVRSAIKQRASLDQIAAAGLEYVLRTYTPPAPVEEHGGKRFVRVNRLPPGVVIIHRKNFDEIERAEIVNSTDEQTLADACDCLGAYVLESAPTSRQVSPNLSLACREPEWMLAQLTERRHPLVEGDWRSQAWRGFAITTIAIDDRIAEVFAPVAQMLAEGLRELGFFAAVLPRNTIWNSHAMPEGSDNGGVAWNASDLPGPIHIVLGALLAVPDVDIPPGSIFYCAEQPAPAWVSHVKRDTGLYRPSVIWCWAEPVTQALRAEGLPAVTVELGHVRGLESKRVDQNLIPFTPVADKDIDVLFFGGMTARRRRILGELTTRGLRVHYERACWGERRDELIARSKVILNIRGNDTPGAVFEVVRVLPLLARRAAVVSETGEGWRRFELGCRFVEAPNEIPDAIEELVRDDNARATLERDALACVRAQPQADILRKLFQIGGNA